MLYPPFSPLSSTPNVQTEQVIIIILAKELLFSRFLIFPCKNMHYNYST